MKISKFQKLISTGPFALGPTTPLLLSRALGVCSIAHQ